MWGSVSILSLSYCWMVNHARKLGKAEQVARDSEKWVRSGYASILHNEQPINNLEPVTVSLIKIYHGEPWRRHLQSCSLIPS